MKLQIATFQVDVSARIGQRLCGGLIPDAKHFRDPQYARGVILDDGRQRVVLAVVDYCEICGAFHEEWRRLLARAAGTTPRHVALHTVHQHDAPLLRSGMVRAAAQGGLKTFDPRWWKRISRRLEAAVRRATRQFREVAAIGAGRAKVRQAAGNRRILGPNGRVIDSRWSICADPRIRNRPEGVIDPWMRTVTFWGASQRLLATLSYYASHPQCAQGRGTVSADAPGEALRRIARKYSRAFHGYFTGCEGNVTFGKYSTLNKERNLRGFGQRLAAAIDAAIRTSRNHRSTDVSMNWRSIPFSIPLRWRKPRSAWREAIADRKKPVYERACGALSLGAWLDRKYLRRQSAAVLRLGDCRIVHLPGEVFVEYQLLGQKQRPGQFVAFAALGDSTMGYIPTARAFQEGGYEPSELATCTTPAVEPKLKAVISRCLR